LRPEPDGVRVHRAVVRAVERTDKSRWRVTTDHGTALVDRSGNAGCVIPMDVEIARELYLHGGAEYLVRATLVDQVRDLDRDHALDGDRYQDRGDDLGLD
jgi:hypothetical protein